MLAALMTGQVALGQESPASSYSPVVIKEDFSVTVQRMAAAKPQIQKQHETLLEDRYDLSDRPAQG